MNRESKKYVDIPAVIQVIGNIYINNKLLDNEKYFFQEDDFTEEFHKIIFGSIYNLHLLGSTNITVTAIEDYLASRPKMLAIYQLNKGTEWLQNVTKSVQISSFDYYYQRMKKMSLLRGFVENSIDISWLYDPDEILNVKKKQAQEDWLDNTSLQEIVDSVENRIVKLKAQYVNDSETESVQAGKGIRELLADLKKNPEIGLPLYGPMINTITRGARLGKFYIRSAATGVGKTRAFAADACTISCSEIYNPKLNKWERNPAYKQNPSLFIATEQEIDEVQTLFLAFISGVDERIILENAMTPEEEERVIKAAEIIEESPIYIKPISNFSLAEIENTIKFHILQYKVKYVFFDYLHSTVKMLGEISANAGVRGLREDNILFMFSTRLKDLCVEYDIFIMTASQLNGEYVNAQKFDQNLLRGAKSIADKADVGMMILEATDQDIAALQPLIDRGMEVPDTKIAIYKNRRGPYRNLLLWCKSNKGTCRIDPAYATDYNYELMQLENLKIEVKGAF